MVPLPSVDLACFKTRSLSATAVRSGQCPLAKPTPNGRCVMECTVDADCALSQKCCYNGCGLTCTSVLPNGVNAEGLSPVVVVNPEPKPGACPATAENSGSLFGHCSILCKLDVDCKGDEKCCKFGCNFRCARPENGPVVPTQRPAGKP